MFIFGIAACIFAVGAGCALLTYVKDLGSARRLNAEAARIYARASKVCAEASAEVATLSAEAEADRAHTKLMRAMAQGPF